MFWCPKCGAWLMSYFTLSGIIYECSHCDWSSKQEIYYTNKTERL